MEEAPMRRRVANTVKWSIIDRLSTQVLYAITGIVLARMLSREAFGLVGAAMVFQAFATLLVDSGFSSALIQRKSPEPKDYSTVFWFNMAVALVLYALLWLAAPLISALFDGGRLLVDVSRVMFLSIPLTALTIVPVNRLTKTMRMKPIAAANGISLIAGAVAGIGGALWGLEAWAIVAQTLTMASAKVLVLATIDRKILPAGGFALWRLKSFFRVGSSIMFSNFLNVVFQNIYSFFIGNRVGLVALGYYTQADKWSKMGYSSLAQVVNSSFLPALSAYQDDRVRFAAATAKMSRLTAWLSFPALGLLSVMAEPIFHILFGTKWDDAIPLFQLLLARGALTVLQSLYNNFILARGMSALLVKFELLRDSVAIAAIVLTLPYIALETAGNPVIGLEIFLLGQVVATAASWIVTLIVTARRIGRTTAAMLLDLTPYAAMTLLVMAVGMLLSRIISHDLTLLAIQIIACSALYLGINALLGSVIQRQAIDYLLGRSREY